ncbi:MAG: Inosine-uridine preferring nucleoside hydrolase, partial [uncultured Chloroflexia bacterium]
CASYWIPILATISTTRTHLP